MSDSERIEALTESTGDGPTFHGDFIAAEPMSDTPTPDEGERT